MVERNLAQLREKLDFEENSERIRKAEERRKRRELKRTQIQSLEILFTETPTTFDLLDRIAVLKRNMLIGDILLLAMFSVNMYLLISRK